MELKTVECPFCGNAQEEDVEDSSFICDECGEIFYDNSDVKK